MTKKLFIHVFLYFIGISSACAQGVKITKEDINSAVWANVKDSAVLDFTETSSGGEFTGCELRYTYPYLDYRNRNGQPVVVVGSVASYYTKGKAFSLFLKIQPQVIELVSGKASIKIVDPKIATIKSGDANLNKFKLTSFRCEGGGYCAGYGSSNESFMEATIGGVGMYSPAIFFNFSSGGTDVRIDLQDLGDKSKSQLSLIKFNGCLGKILEFQIKDLENQPKK
jgi:hypothetical protein